MGLFCIFVIRIQSTHTSLCLSVCRSVHLSGEIFEKLQKLQHTFYEWGLCRDHVLCASNTCFIFLILERGIFPSRKFFMISIEVKLFEIISPHEIALLFPNDNSNNLTKDFLVYFRKFTFGIYFRNLD